MANSWGKNWHYPIEKYISRMMTVHNYPKHFSATKTQYPSAGRNDQFLTRSIIVYGSSLPIFHNVRISYSAHVQSRLKQMPLAYLTTNEEQLQKFGNGILRFGLRVSKIQVFNLPHKCHIISYERQHEGHIIKKVNYLS